MKSLKTIAFTVGLSGMFLLGACGDGTLDKLKSAKDELCACKDKECLEKVEKKLQESITEKDLEKIMKDESLAKEFAKIGEEGNKCRQKILNAGGDEEKKGE
jgi:hypothetical protein